MVTVREEDRADVNLYPPYLFSLGRTYGDPYHGIIFCRGSTPTIMYKFSLLYIYIIICTFEFFFFKEEMIAGYTVWNKKKKERTIQENQ